MALITISGYPCSGKTRRANELKAYFENSLASPDYAGPKLKVLVISDDSVNIKREVYNDSRSEKPARSAVFTAMTREIGKDTILIMDGMNYIKGFRYQMYCSAREAEVRVCTVFVVATPDLCRDWNSQRDPSESYSSETFDNLVMRYEEPNSMARWDAPLYTVPWSDEKAPVQSIWDVVTAGARAPSNVAVLLTVKPPTDALQTLENISASIVSLISSSNLQGVGGTVPLSVSPSIRITITLPPRNISLSELQRHKRQFVTVHKKTITQGTKGALDWNEQTVARKFVDYLEEHLNT